MKNLSRITVLVILCALLPAGAGHGASWSDIMGSKYQFGVTYPGIFCKTRTNNEASVRNLAHGVLNRDTSNPVALNCGVPAPWPYGADLFNDNARVDAWVFVVFGRNSNVSNSDFADAFCNIYVSKHWDPAASPGAPSSDAVSLGQVRPTGFADDQLFSAENIQTNGVAYPDIINFFTAFCRVPQGVRIQVVGLEPYDTIGTHP